MYSLCPLIMLILHLGVNYLMRNKWLSSNLEDTVREASSPFVFCYHRTRWRVILVQMDLW